MILFRDLLKEEIEQVWEIDRSEVIENIYYLENDVLVLKPEFYNMTGWPPGEAEAFYPILLNCFTQGGWFHGLFEDSRLIGVVVLDNKFIGKNKDTLQLKFLHVSAAHRSHGYGGQLFELARLKVEERGAAKCTSRPHQGEDLRPLTTGGGDRPPPAGDAPGLVRPVQERPQRRAAHGLFRFGLPLPCHWPDPRRTGLSHQPVRRDRAFLPTHLW